MNRDFKGQQQIHQLCTEAAQRISSLRELWQNWVFIGTIDAQTALKEASQIDIRIPAQLWENDIAAAIQLTGSMTAHLPMIYAMTMAIKEIQETGQDFSNKFVRIPTFYKYLPDSCVDQRGTVIEPPIPFSSDKPTALHVDSPEPEL